METHFAKKNDCLSSLAAENGFGDLKAIYDHPDNGELKSQRDNPDLLSERDKVRIPDIRPQKISGQTDTRHTFRRKMPAARLRLQLLDEDAEPMANLDFKLTLSADDREGITDGEGRLDVEIPPTELRGQLQLWPDEGEPLEWDLHFGQMEPVDSVRGLQARVKNLGIEVGAVDGIVGPKTERAVRQFQAENSLVVDGISGPKTQAALKKVYGC